METDSTAWKNEGGRGRVDKTGEDQVKKSIGNAEFGTESNVSQSFDRFYRPDEKNQTSQWKIHWDTREETPRPGNHDGDEDELNVFSVESCPEKENVSDRSGLTFDIIKESKESDKSKDCKESNGDTYDVAKSEEKNSVVDADRNRNRPVPAPRRRPPEKLSSDTDRDVAEIDSEEARLKSDSESKSGKLNVEKTSESVAVPKPRKLIANTRTENRVSRSQSSDSEERSTAQKREKPEGNGQMEKSGEKSSVASRSAELPIIKTLTHVYELKSAKEVESNVKKKRKLKIVDLIERRKRRRKKSSKALSSAKPKSPKTSSASEEVKEREFEEEGESADGQTDSSRYPESTQNGKIYVQDKNGFRLVEKEDFLKSGNSKGNDGGRERTMEESTVKTAILFQKYWSRTMIYFHGILAGFAFGHTAMVTAIILHFNYEPKKFIEIYSTPSLKIHFVFYALTTFSIVSCFDRIDIGHLNRKHWKTAWKAPSMWSALFIYIISFALTFTNHKTEERFDSCQYLQGNYTYEKIWDAQGANEIQVSLLTWFHIIWARDILLMIAWFIISLTKFSDFLSGHLNNMVKYAQVTN